MASGKATRSNSRTPTESDALDVLDLVEPDLRADLVASLEEGIREGAVFPWQGNSVELFRAALGESIRDIEAHPRGELLQRFLRIGPYHDSGEIPAGEAERFLTDAETASAISFIYASVLRSFQGQLAELLAIAPMLRLLRQLQTAGKLPCDARLYVGDAVAASRLKSAGAAKAADLHLLSDESTAGRPSVTVHGVGEVKSYPATRKRVMAQLEKHWNRVEAGMVVGGRDVPPARVCRAERPLRVMVVPTRWRLSRAFRFEERDGSTFLDVDRVKPPASEDALTALGGGRWCIRLRWSHEALASAAYDMTFWYMEKVGEVVYRRGVPAEWAPMTPEEAGRNAAKMMLYYAILRARSGYENQSSVGLYNVYGFGYALGHSFRDARGRHDMLWPEDLREILRDGVTKHGCKLRGWRRPRGR